MLGLFKNFAAIPIPLLREDGYHIHAENIAAEIARGTSVILTSNPRNPTGRTLTNPELAQVQDICRDRATLIMDEFYGGYNYTSDCDGTVVSAADNIDDVDEDDVLIIDGLTKRFRLPGWRVAWIVGPKEFIKAIGSCGSYLDGGTNVPFQEAAIPMLEPTKVRNEMKALQFHFREKRDYVLGRLEDMGFKLDYTPDSTFYIWLNLGALPQEINDGLNFFQACLKEKVIVVPGIFFDLNPSKRRDLFDSPCHHFVRVSYGPKVCSRVAIVSPEITFTTCTDFDFAARDFEGWHGWLREGSQEVQRLPRSPEVDSERCTERDTRSKVVSRIASTVSKFIQVY
jgi:aspartate/methionine/tyrosine aminotransferase